MWPKSWLASRESLDDGSKLAGCQQKIERLGRSVARAYNRGDKITVLLGHGRAHRIVAEQSAATLRGDLVLTVDKDPNVKPDILANLANARDVAALDLILRRRTHHVVSVHLVTNLFLHGALRSMIRRSFDRRSDVQKLTIHGRPRLLPPKARDCDCQGIFLDNVCREINTD